MWWYLLVVAVLLLLWLLRRRYSYWERRGVPCPLQPEFPWGNLRRLILLQESPRETLDRLYQAGRGYPVVGCYLALKPALLVRDPTLARKLLTSEFSSFSDRHSSTGEWRDPLGHANLFLLKNPKWRALRIKLSPAFTAGHLRRMMPLVESCGRRMLDQGLDRGPVDVRDTMARFTTDCISNCVFGIDTNAVGDPSTAFRQFGRKIFDFTPYRALEVVGFFFLPWLAKISGFSFFHTETAHFLRTAFWDVIRSREKSGYKRNDFVDLLIELKNKGIIRPAEEAAQSGKPSEIFKMEKPMYDFEGDDLVAQAAIFYSAGFETTASTLMFTLYELAYNPDIQEKLRSEIIKAVDQAPDRQLNYDLINGIEYLNLVIAETLRKYPPFPMVDRECSRSCQLTEQLMVERGTPLLIPVMSLHHDPSLFQDPERYDPERFKDGKPPQYLPFGDGPRVCIGARFAHMVLRTALVQLLSRGFEVVPCSETPPPPLTFNKYSILTGIQGQLPLLFRSSTPTA